jgi:SAM-dependent methyltransferase
VRRRAARWWRERNGSQAAVPPAPSPPDPEHPTEDGQIVDAQVPLGDEAVDVRELIGTLTVEELAVAADEYYVKNLDGVDYYFAKPLTNVDEAPDFMTGFAQVLAGVRPLSGMVVLDFGAGTGWSSRYLTQLGYEVIVCDVSSCALDVAKQLFERQPVAGRHVPPRFLNFDGRRFDLPDESVDRIVCIDAFHHVPNPEAVLAEMGRVLRPGGVAGFQEPGPNHSKKAQSQFEMKNYTVIENDILMGDIWAWAKDAGFTDIELAVFTSEPFHLSVDDYGDFLRHGPTVDRYYDHVRRFVEDRRIFFLSKGEPLTSDSRERRGLLAHLDVRLDSQLVDGTIRGVADIENTGSNIWLPSDADLGPVRLGVHLYGAGGALIDRDFARIDLPSGSGPGVRPGEKVRVEFAIPAPAAPGDYLVEFDLVAEHVCWFEINESKVSRRPVTVH